MMRTLFVWLLLGSSCLAQTVYDEVAASVRGAYPKDFWKNAAVTRAAGEWHNRILRGQAVDSRAEVAFYKTTLAQGGIDLCGIATPRLRVALRQAGYG